MSNRRGSPLPYFVTYSFGPVAIFHFKMPRFFSGDELGNIKALTYSKVDPKVNVVTLYDGSSRGKHRAVQKIAVSTAPTDGQLLVRLQTICGSVLSLTDLEEKLVVSCADGSASVSQLKPEGLEPLREWTEPRLRPGQKYVGLSASSAYVVHDPWSRSSLTFPSGVYSCTSNGALRLTPFGEHDAESQAAVLPMRLCEWRSAPDGKTFSYGGDEVELSVWDLEAAFAPKQPAPQPEGHTKKRKRDGGLLPGELWRAKNARRDDPADPRLLTLGAV